VPFKQETVVSRRNQFFDFIKKWRDETEDGRYMYYIKQEMLVSKNLQQDIVKPLFISNLVRNRATGLTIWKSFDRKSEYKEKERYHCVVKGEETFRIVSPVYKQNIYSGVLEELPPTESPIDLFSKVDPE
jgi:hypothetical protein